MGGRGRGVEKRAKSVHAARSGGKEERECGSGAGAETLLCGKDQRKMLKCKYI